MPTQALRLTIKNLVVNPYTVTNPEMPTQALRRKRRLKQRLHFGRRVTNPEMPTQALRLDNCCRDNLPLIM